MKISKHIHSCLLVEENSQTFLFDPGSFSYNARALDVKNLKQLDYILITHDHGDHLCIPFMKEILQKFPGTKIITNPSAARVLAKENIAASTKGTDFIDLVP